MTYWLFSGMQKSYPATWKLPPHLSPFTPGAFVINDYTVLYEPWSVMSPLITPYYTYLDVLHRILCSSMYGVNHDKIIPWIKVSPLIKPFYRLLDIRFYALQDILFCRVFSPEVFLVTALLQLGVLNVINEIALCISRCCFPNHSASMWAVRW